MKVVILGAGASYDSINEFNEDAQINGVMAWQPPMGNDLFGGQPNFREIRDNYPGAVALSSRIRTANDIEDFFQERWDIIQKTNDIHLFANLINSQYYLQDLFYQISVNYSSPDVGVSNYAHLVQMAYDYCILKNEEVAFITFNYDLLLEFSLTNSRGAQPGTFLGIQSYIQPPIKIFKPHGSCNWFRPFNGNFSPKGFINDQLLESKHSPAHLSNVLSKEIVADSNALDRNRQNKKVVFCSKDETRYFPQILVPIKDKDEFVMPENHELEMKNCLKKASEVLVVGWKGQEKHFLKTLGETIGEKSVNITLVTCEDSKVESSLRAVMPNSNISHFSKAYVMEKEPISSEREIIVSHPRGSFSSYIMHITMGHPETKEKLKGIFNVN